MEPSEIFKVLGVETRVKIIELLKAQGSLGSNAIAERLGITPAAVSQHLKLLRQAGLVKSERQGYWIPYTINAEALEDCKRILTEVCTCGCKQPDKFKARELNGVCIGSLKQYEHDLAHELQRVRQKIEEIESRND